jgi:hypothetical protein
MDISAETRQKIVALLKEEMQTWIATHPEATVMDLETELREGMQQVGATCLQTALEMQNARYPQRQVDCACGEQAQYMFQRTAKTLSVFGWVSYRRAYYLCPHCHQGQYPVDRRWDLRPGQVSAALASLLAVEGIDISFEGASRKIAKLLLVKVSENTVRRVTQRFGAAQEDAERAWQAESQDMDNLNARRRTIQDPPQRLYGALDGVTVPLKAEWCELKCGCWYEVELKGHRAPHDVGDTGSLHAQQISYYCDVADAASFRELVWTTGYRRCADRASEIVFVSDGAAWIWKTVEHHFPQATQIVDWYHAAQYLSAIAKVAFEEGSLEGAAWLERARAQLWDGRVSQAIAICEEQASKPGAAAAVHKAVTYYSNNMRRMDYARFRAQGYQIGSGTVESACKQLGTQRLRRAGARWKESGARLTAKARAAWLSGDWKLLEARYAARA